MNTKIIRTIHPEVRVVDATKGIVDYVASDETIDSYREVIVAAGWKFTNFSKNAPFVDSHDYSTITKCVGRVLDFHVQEGKLIERVQWAIDVPENQLAQIGWKMTQAGYLKAVSVGFFPTQFLTPSSGTAWAEALAALKLPPDAEVRCIYTEQEQVELSCCIIGANPNALAKMVGENVLTASEADLVGRGSAEPPTTPPLPRSRPEAIQRANPLLTWAIEQKRQKFLADLRQLQTTIPESPCDKM